VGVKKGCRSGSGGIGGVIVVLGVLKAGDIKGFKPQGWALDPQTPRVFGSAPRGEGLNLCRGRKNALASKHFCSVDKKYRESLFALTKYKFLVNTSSINCKISIFL